MEDFTAVLGLPPLEGNPRTYVFHLPLSLPARRTEPEMTPEDWDKFEKDIADAFERVP